MKSDDKFVEGMRAALALAGPGHTAESMYMGKNGPECIVGFGLHIAGMPCPVTNAPADMILREYGISPKVRAAARAAQIVQDFKVPWGLAMEAFEKAMAMYDYKSMKGVYTEESGYVAHLAYGIAKPYIEHTEAYRMKQELKAAWGMVNVQVKQAAAEMQKAVDDLTAALAEVAKKPVMASYPKVEVNVVHNAAGQVVATYPQVAYGALFQKDHALTA